MGPTRRLRRLLCGQQNTYISVRGRRLRIYLKARNKRNSRTKFLQPIPKFPLAQGKQHVEANRNAPQLVKRLTTTSTPKRCFIPFLV
ncbi:unnamed protein product [Ixodes pacificus]